jgi:hypothetical protein
MIIFAGVGVALAFEVRVVTGDGPATPVDRQSVVVLVITAVTSQSMVLKAKTFWILDKPSL